MFASFYFPFLLEMKAEQSIFFIAAVSLRHHQYPQFRVLQAGHRLSASGKWNRRTILCHIANSVIRPLAVIPFFYTHFVIRRADLIDPFVFIAVDRTVIFEAQSIRFLEGDHFLIRIPTGNFTAPPILKPEPAFVRQYFMIAGKTPALRPLSTGKLKQSVRSTVLTDVSLRCLILFHRGLRHL